MDKKNLKVITNLYWEQKAAVRLRVGNSDEFDIERGVRQGCVLSPKLFNLYAEPIVRGSKKNYQASHFGSVCGVCVCKRERQTDRQTDRQRQRQTEREREEGV